jgi:hypothetical protein
MLKGKVLSILIFRNFQASEIKKLRRSSMQKFLKAVIFYFIKQKPTDQYSNRK